MLTSKSHLAMAILVKVKLLDNGYSSINFELLLYMPDGIYKAVFIVRISPDPPVIRKPLEISMGFFFW